MPQCAQEWAELDSTSGDLVLRFPPNTRLHEGEHGAFRILIRKARKVVFLENPSDVLRDIVEAAANHTDSVKKVSGDHQHIRLHFVPGATIDTVLRSTVLACMRNNYRLSYKGPQLTTAIPLYAV